MKRNLFSLAVLALGLAACSQDDLQFDTPEANAPVFSKEVSEPGSTKVSYNLAEKVALSTQFETRTEKIVNDIETLYSENGEPLIYAVNFANSNGYVLVSATKNYHPILADVKSGSFNVLNIPDNLRYFIEEYKNAIKYYNNAPEDSTLSYRLRWSKYTKDEIAVKKPTKTRSSDVYLDDFIFDSQMKWRAQGYRWTSLDRDELGLDFFEDVLTEMEDFESEQDLSTCYIVWKPVETITQVDPLLKMHWHGGEPYNSALPKYYYLNDYSIALAQMMKFRNKPMDINWKDLKDDYDETDSIPTNVATKLKILHTMTDFTINKLNIDSAMYLGATILRSNGFLLANTASHNINTLLSNLKNNSPVIGCAISNFNDGRVWIYDGIIDSDATYYYYLLIPRKNPQTSDYFKYIWDEREIKQDITLGYTHIHLNWGMGGAHDGWYLDNNIGYTNSAGYEIKYSKTRKDIINL